MLRWNSVTERTSLRSIMGTFIVLKAANYMITTTDGWRRGLALKPLRLGAFRIK